MLEREVHVSGLVLKEKPHLCEVALKETSYVFGVHAEAQFHQQPPMLQPVQVE